MTKREFIEALAPFEDNAELLFDAGDDKPWLVVEKITRRDTANQLVVLLEPKDYNDV